MRVKQRIQAFKDNFHPNEYELKEYVIQDGKKHPFALICAGGGYEVVCSYVEGVPYAERLNKTGYSVFILYYHVKEKAKYPTPQQDVAKALKEILANTDKYNLDTKNYSIWGSTAGGHLVASFGTESMGYVKYGLPKPGALILTYPVITMGEKTHEGSQKNLLGKNPTEEMILLTSVEQQVTKAYPPTFLWCGSADPIVSPENSHMLVQELERNLIPYEFEEYSGVEHGVGLGEGLTCEPWFDRTVRFWEKQRQGGIK